MRRSCVAAGPCFRELHTQPAKDAGLSHISTNDVLTSWLMREIGDAGFMMLNMRTRVGELTASHAGNYEHPALLNNKVRQPALSSEGAPCPCKLLPKRPATML